MSKSATLLQRLAFVAGALILEISPAALAQSTIGVSVQPSFSQVSLYESAANSSSLSSHETYRRAPGILQVQTELLDVSEGEQQVGNLQVSGNPLPPTGPGPGQVWIGCPVVTGTTWIRKAGDAEWTQVNQLTAEFCFGPFVFVKEAQDEEHGGLIVANRRGLNYTHYFTDKHHVCTGETSGFFVGPDGKEPFSYGLCQTIADGAATPVTHIDEVYRTGEAVSLAAGDEYRMDLHITDGDETSGPRTFDTSQTWTLVPTSSSDSSATCDKDPALWFGELPHRAPPDLLPKQSCGSLSSSYTGLCGGGQFCP